MSTLTSTYQKKLFWLVGITVLLKMVLSYFVELGNDEVYYYTYAVQSDWNHFDHPPMVGWMIKLTTLNLYWVSELSMRIGAIIASALATVVIFETGILLKNAKAGFIAALLYSFSIYTSIIAGLFVLPDSPQLLFFTLSIYCMVKWVSKPFTFKFDDWILLGLFIGLATLSKVHGLFLWAGFGAFILFHKIESVKQRNVYVAFLVTVICILPIIFWNFQNDFITYTFHSKRVTHSGISLDSFLQQVLGEFIYQNPLVYVACLIAFINTRKVKLIANSKAAINLLLWLSLPLIFTFWLLSLFNPTLPHWTGPGFIALFLIAGVYWGNYTSKGIPNLLKWAGGLLGGLIIAFLLLVYTFPTQLGSAKIENLGEYNPINDVTGWRHFSKEFEKLVTQDRKLNKMSLNAPIVINKWFPGGHILFYTATPMQLKVIAIGNIEDVHKFAWLNQEQEGLKIGEDAYCIVPSNLPSNPQQVYGPYFEKILTPDTIPIKMKGVVLRNFYVYRLKYCKQLPPSILGTKK
jgi:hypothetical protein